MNDLLCRNKDMHSLIFHFVLFRLAYTLYYII